LVFIEKILFLPVKSGRNVCGVLQVDDPYKKRERGVSRLNGIISDIIVDADDNRPLVSLNENE